MNRLTYNISMAAGLCTASAGAGVQWGGGVGLMVFGALSIAITLITIKVAA